MYKSMTLLVLVALAACVFASQDQESAEQYHRIHGVYPSWYPYGTTSYTGVRAWSYPTAAYPASAYPASAYPAAYPYAYSGYPAAAYPTASVAGVKNVVTPYAAYGYGYNALPYGYNTYPYGAYGAVPYVAAAPAATPVKA